MEAARGRGWSAVPSWGLDGWDLGAWPLVVISHRRSADDFELAYDVEGDITVYRYPTRVLRDAATDCLAFWHWKHDDEDWVDGVECVDADPDRLRGSFSWERLRRHQPEPALDHLDAGRDDCDSAFAPEGRNRQEARVARRPRVGEQKRDRLAACKEGDPMS
jgi:hypothetical protein